MKKEFVRNPYNYDSDELSNETGLHCKDKSLTAQEFLEESDINYIAEKFMKTGELKVVPDMPTPGDFEGIFDFQTAMNTIVHAKQEFMLLPAKIRSRFDNDPAKLIAYLDNMTDNDRAEAIALGLIKPPEPKDEPKPEDRSTPQTPPQDKAGTTGTPSNDGRPATSKGPGQKPPVRPGDGDQG